jgi:hypothetical protein
METNEAEDWKSTLSSLSTIVFISNSISHMFIV